MSWLISPLILSPGLHEGPLYHGSGSVEWSDDDGSLLTHVYFYSVRICIMHVALTKHPAPDSTRVLSGLRLGLSSWVGWCIKFLEAPLPPVYTCKYSRAAEHVHTNTQIHTCRKTHTHIIIHVPADQQQHQMLCCSIHILRLIEGRHYVGFAQGLCRISGSFHEQKVAEGHK